MQDMRCLIVLLCLLVSAGWSQGLAQWDPHPADLTALDPPLAVDICHIRLPHGWARRDEPERTIWDFHRWDMGGVNVERNGARLYVNVVRMLPPYPSGQPQYFPSDELESIAGDTRNLHRQWTAEPWTTGWMGGRTGREARQMRWTGPDGAVAAVDYFILAPAHGIYIRLLNPTGDPRTWRLLNSSARTLTVP